MAHCYSVRLTSFPVRFIINRHPDQILGGHEAAFVYLYRLIYLICGQSSISFHEWKSVELYFNHVKVYTFCFKIKQKQYFKRTMMKIVFINTSVSFIFDMNMQILSWIMLKITFFKCCLIIIPQQIVKACVCVFRSSAVLGVNSY